MNTNIGFLPKGTESSLFTNVLTLTILAGCVLSFTHHTVVPLCNTMAGRVDGWMDGKQAFALPLKLRILDSSHSDFSSSHIQVLKFICSCFTGLIEEYSFMCYNLQNQHILIGI